MDLEDIWQDAFRSVQSHYGDYSSQLLTLSILMICACRVWSMIRYDGWRGQRSLRTDLLFRCGWYCTLAVLAWHETLLEALAYWCVDHPDSPVVDMMPEWVDSYWIEPLTVMLVCMPLIPAVGRSSRRWWRVLELLTAILAAATVVAVVLPNLFGWMLFRFCLLIDWSLKGPYRPPVAEWPEQLLPEAVRTIRLLCSISLASCLAGAWLLDLSRLREISRWRLAAGLACTAVAGLVAWHVDFYLIVLVSPSAGLATFSHEMLSPVVSGLLLAPGIVWFAWMRVCRHKVLRAAAGTDIQLPLLEILFGWVLAVCIGMELSDQLFEMTERSVSDLDFIAWAVAFLCCVRALLQQRTLVKSQSPPVHRLYFADLGVIELGVGIVITLVQIVTFAIAVQWLAGMCLIFPGT